MKNNFYVYEWFVVETGEIFYVGKGKDNRVTSMKDRNEYFKNIRKKYECNYRFVKKNLNEEEAYNLELEYGLFLKEKGLAKACYILGKTNKFVDNRTKKKISKTLKENKEKSIWNKGIKNCYSDETLLKMRNAKLGNKQTEETKSKRSKSLLQKVAKINPQNNEIICIYNSINEAAQDIKRNASGISKCFSGKIETCGGYKWEKIK